MRILKFHFLDIVLCAALGYLTYDVIAHSEDYSTCSEPINYWLLALYIVLLLFRLTTNIVINSDQCCLITIFRIVLIFGLIPFLIEWTVHGTIWYLDISHHTPNCIPEYRLPSLIIWWLFVCYVLLIILLGVFLYEIICYVKKRKINAIIQAYLNSEMSQNDIQYLTSLIETGELSPEEIPLSKAEFNHLQTSKVTDIFLSEIQCSICCEDLKEGEEFIKLMICSHLFHKNCLEIWLKRKPLCPNCKRNIRNDIVMKIKSESLEKRETVNCEDEKEIYRRFEEEKEKM